MPEEKLVDGGIAFSIYPNGRRWSIFILNSKRKHPPLSGCFLQIIFF